MFQVLLQVTTNTCTGYTSKKLDELMFTTCFWDASKFARDFRWDEKNWHSCQNTWYSLTAYAEARRVFGDGSVYFSYQSKDCPTWVKANTP
jgi:hypothetical protein